MTSGRRLMALAVAAGFLVLLPSCHHGGPTAVGPQYIMLTYNNGTCQQNGGTGLVDVAPNQAAIFQGAAALSQFQVQFSTCPFGTCPVNSPNGNSINAGQPNAGTAGKTFYYSGLTINNQPCTNTGSLGLRVWPP